MDMDNKDLYDVHIDQSEHVDVNRSTFADAPQDDALVNKYNQLYMTCVIDLKMQLYTVTALYIIYSVIFGIIIYKYSVNFNKAKRTLYVFEAD